MPTPETDQPIASHDIDKILGAVKSPMIFNALAVVLATILGWRLGTAEHINPSIVWYVFGFIAAIAIWLNIMAAVKPRFLAYGPAEYLRESELRHERIMAGKESV